MGNSPSVTADGAFVAANGSVMKLDRVTGEARWRYTNPATGGSGLTAVVVDDRLFARDANVSFAETGTRNAVFNAQTGTVLRSFPGTTWPAVADGHSYHVHQGALYSIDLATGNTRWSFTYDTPLVTAPLVIDNMVFVGGVNFRVFLIDAVTGAALWRGEVPQQLENLDESSSIGPVTASDLGSGYLLVPAGNTVTGWRLVP